MRIREDKNEKMKWNVLCFFFCFFLAEKESTHYFVRISELEMTTLRAFLDMTPI